MKVAFLTLGCKVNQYETQAMREILEKDGFLSVPFEDIADLYIINTCTVTNIADRKSRQMINQAHRRNPDAKICVCGCLAQRDAVSLKAVPYIDAVIGVNEKQNISGIVKSIFSNKTQVLDVSDIMSQREYDSLKISRQDERVRANLKISDGCTNFCSYCIIPYARGPVRSKSLDDIKKEASVLAESGIKEIVLTGIQVASYGKDLESSTDLCDAINAARAEGIKRIRLSSMEPRILTDEFCSRLSEIPELCRHFHISLQSGSDTVLKRMNRKYTSAEYEGYINNLRRHFDRPSITTDVIVGFPGETASEFEETAAFLKKIGFLRVHLFPYSKREGTPAAKMGGQIPNSEKKERLSILSDIQKDITYEILKSFVGSKDRVLIETEGTDGFSYGHTDRYIEVRCQGKPNEFKDVIIMSVDREILTADNV
ncbi:MAG: tRNA (N(6)-L-threonylcarbamoyladenosine(37)-C(2))-methylthiotransferase MtaB [Clostridia bacterium]|nr:tRNA (N(6)-L-threonylcarbamoyladenosine(37)-C(2))-methylthiotransferase MtaB [Christensenellaceae bacterium]MBR6239556.1 tRNA (N(6)-L-threonylcarbamoyladenosine(37)-C(2))-methylthiotransferase MtaB [Clostridia bacterium]